MATHVGTWGVERLLVQDPAANLCDLSLLERFAAGGICHDPDFTVTGLAAPDVSFLDGAERALGRPSWGYGIWDFERSAIVGVCGGPVSGHIHEFLRAEVLKIS